MNAVERLSKPIRETLHGKVRTFLERIKAGVFRTALKKNKVLVLLNHNYERVLASTEDGNAILEEDNIGLKADITIADREVVQKAREGKLSGWSFGFIANDDELTTEGNDEIRTVTDMELLEVSILDETKSPAYYGTSIESREGGARMVEIRADAFATEGTEKPTAENEQKISIDELASLVAAKKSEPNKREGNDHVLFNKNKSVIIAYPASSREVQYDIPDSIVSISDWAFCECKKLNRITIPDSVHEIGEGAFCNCILLDEVEIPDSVVKIDDCTFRGCTSLEKVIIPSSVKELGWGLFDGCEHIVTVYCDEGSAAQEYCRRAGIREARITEKEED